MGPSSRTEEGAGDAEESPQVGRVVELTSRYRGFGRGLTMETPVIQLHGLPVWSSTAPTTKEAASDHRATLPPDASLPEAKATIFDRGASSNQGNSPETTPSEPSSSPARGGGR